MSLEHDLARAFLDDHPADAALVLERMPVGERAAVVRDVPEQAARALREMGALTAAEALERLSAEEAAPALDHLPLDTAIGVLRRMPSEAAQRLIGGLSKDKQEALGRVLTYPDNTAGALMDPMVFSLPDDISAAEARLRLRRETRGLLHYLFVVSRDQMLVGVLDIPELMQAKPRDEIRALMNDRVEHVPAWTPTAAVRTHPAWQAFHALPVTDDAGRLVGAIRYQTLRRLEQDANTRQGAEITSATVGALGELFHLGLAGMVEGVAAAASPRRPPLTDAAPRADRGGR